MSPEVSQWRVAPPPSSPRPRPRPLREDVPPLLLRAGLAALTLLLEVDPRYHTVLPAWPFALLLLLGVFSRLNAWLTLLLGIRAAVTPPYTALAFLTLFALSMMARRISMLGPGRYSLDVHLIRDSRFGRWLDAAMGRRADGRVGRLNAQRRQNWRHYEGYLLRFALALVLLPGGVHFVLRGGGDAWLGGAWLAAGGLLAAGLLTDEAALAAAVLLPLGTLAAHNPFFAGLPFVAVALVFLEHDKTSLDAWLRRERLRRRAGRRVPVLEPVDAGGDGSGPGPTRAWTLQRADKPRAPRR